MANTRRARKAEPRKAAKGAISKSFREAVEDAVFDIEEPLREAQHFVHILSAVAQYRGEDNEAISTVAGEAGRKLDIVDRHLNKIFAACRRESS